jgi:long-chain fatty acid transport protein
MHRWAIAFLMAMVLGTAPAQALTDEEIFRDLRFNLINPGARSLALGGAFVSLADDATAAQANPAGLGFLLKQEYFIELRAIDHAARSSVRTEELPAGIDTFVAAGTDQDDVISPTFASVVTTYGRWSMGLSYQELLNVKNATLSTFAFTFGGSPGVFLVEGDGSLDLGVRNINVSVGGKITDRLGIGGTLT